MWLVHYSELYIEEIATWMGIDEVVKGVRHTTGAVSQVEPAPEKVDSSYSNCFHPCQHSIKSIKHRCAICSGIQAIEYCSEYSLDYDMQYSRHPDVKLQLS